MSGIAFTASAVTTTEFCSSGLLQPEEFERAAVERTVAIAGPATGPAAAAIVATDGGVAPLPPALPATAESAHGPGLWEQLEAQRAAQDEALAARMASEPKRGVASRGLDEEEVRFLDEQAELADDRERALAELQRRDREAFLLARVGRRGAAAAAEPTIAAASSGLAAATALPAPRLARRGAAAGCAASSLEEATSSTLLPPPKRLRVEESNILPVALEPPPRAAPVVAPPAPVSVAPPAALLPPTGGLVAYDSEDSEGGHI